MVLRELILAVVAEKIRVEMCYHWLNKCPSRYDLDVHSTLIAPRRLWP